MLYGFCLRHFVFSILSSVFYVRDFVSAFSILKVLFLCEIHDEDSNLNKKKRNFVCKK